jgi:toxin YhaV
LNSERTCGSKSDAYAVFSSMLRDGNPPDGWGRLLAACSNPDVVERTAATLKKPADET